MKGVEAPLAERPESAERAAADDSGAATCRLVLLPLLVLVVVVVVVVVAAVAAVGVCATASALAAAGAFLASPLAGALAARIISFTYTAMRGGGDRVVSIKCSALSTRSP